VKKYRIRIEVQSDKTDLWEMVRDVLVDYCPRGAERAIGLLDRAIRPPCVRKKPSESSWHRCGVRV